MNLKQVLSAVMISATAAAYGQGAAINTDGSAADASAMLDVKSTSKGVLVPRMTHAERNAISTPATGLLVYQTNDTAGFYYNAGPGTQWQYLNAAGVAGPQGVAGPAGAGFANGTAAGQVYLTGNASPYAPQAPVTLSGDVTVNAAGATTIQNNAVTVGKMATSGTLPAFNGSNLTNLNATSLGSGTVPVARLGTNSPPGGSFLRSDNTWATPAAGAPTVSFITFSAGSTVTVNTAISIYILNYGGTSAASSFTISLPAASAVSAGTTFTFLPEGYTTAPSSVNITSSGTGQFLIAPFNVYNVNISSGNTYNYANTSNLKFMSDGVNTWYRVLF